MAKAPTLAELRDQIAALEGAARQRALTPDGHVRLRRLTNRYAQEKRRLPIVIEATEAKLKRLREAYYG
jgi:hypothetical protein